MDPFVDVYAKDTGLKHRVPAHYLDNPVLMRGFRKTPKPGTTTATDGPSPAATSATPATDVVTATPANPTTSTNDTPAAGAKKE